MRDEFGRLVESEKCLKILGETLGELRPSCQDDIGEFLTRNQAMAQLHVLKLIARSMSSHSLKGGSLGGQDRSRRHGLVRLMMIDAFDAQVFDKDELLPMLCQLQSLKKQGKPTVAIRKLKVLPNSFSAFHIEESHCITCKASARGNLPSRVYW